MMLADLPKDKIIILFDGVCNFCDSSVQFIIKQDRKDVFRFAAIQSAIGQEIIRDLGIDSSKIDSIILYEPGKGHYFKSGAAMKIAGKLGRMFALTSVFSVLPTSLTDFVYDFIAKNRYKWFGKKAECMIPGPEVRAKFL